MAQAHWYFDEAANVVRLQNSEGEPLRISSLDVWRAEFELLQRLDGHNVSPPSSANLGIEFAPEAGHLHLGVMATKSGELVLAFRVNAELTEPVLQYPAEYQIVINNRWFCLDGTQVDELRKQLDLISIPIGKPLSPAQAMELVWKWSLPIDVPPGTDVSFSSDFSFHGDLVHGELYPYQTAGAERLIGLYSAGIGCLLADEMGLGKTVQIIALLKRASDAGKSLVVCPASTLANWKRELSRFAPSLATHIHQGPKRFASVKQLKSFDVVLTSYDTMAQDVHSLKAMQWQVIAFDEAQYVKNPRADRSLSARLLQARSKVAVTGTPIENSLRDMWSLVNLIVPDYLPQLEDFENLYPDASAAAQALGEKVSPIVIRRRLADVAESLPERVTTVVPITMGEEHAEAYNSILSSSQPILAKLTALRTCAASLGTGIGSVKHQFVHELTSEAFSLGNKVLVFASFSPTIDALVEAFKVHGPKLYMAKIDGRTPIDSRQEIIDDFSMHEGPGVLVLNPRAAGVGLNIQSANYVVHYTPEWNPAVVDQASARAHRRGQTQTVFVYHLYYENTIEEVMIERLDKKRALSKAGLAPISEAPLQTEISRIMSFSPLRAYNAN